MVVAQVREIEKLQARIEALEKELAHANAVRAAQADRIYELELRCAKLGGVPSVATVDRKYGP